jgi:hypothetical protein
MFTVHNHLSMAKESIGRVVVSTMAGQDAAGLADAYTEASLSTKYQAYQSIALISTLLTGFSLNDLGNDSSIDSLIGFFHVLSLAIVALTNFRAISLLSLEYFYVMRLFAQGDMITLSSAEEAEGVQKQPVFKVFMDSCRDQRQSASTSVVYTMVVYAISCALGFAKSQGDDINWKAFLVIAAFALGAAMIAWGLAKTHVHLYKAVSHEKFGGLSTARVMLAMNPLTVCKRSVTRSIVKSTNYGTNEENYGTNEERSRVSSK